MRAFCDQIRSSEPTSDRAEARYRTLGETTLSPIENFSLIFRQQPKPLRLWGANGCGRLLSCKNPLRRIVSPLTPWEPNPVHSIVACAHDEQLTLTVSCPLTLVKRFSTS
jgi:hypothetical protein